MRLAYVFFVVALIFAAGSPVVAQDDPAPPAAPPADDSTVQVEPQEPAKKKFRNGLYVYAAWGQGESRDIDASIETLVRRTATSTFSLPEVDYGRAGIGWKLPEHKGNFRLLYTGYREGSFDFLSTGSESALDVSLPATIGINDNLLWWTVTGEPGSLVSNRTPPQWDTSVDANGDGRADQDEVFYNAPDLTVSVGLTDDLQNRVFTTDLLFGNSFGGRRFGSHWWGGFRVYGYDGNVLAGAWLDPGGAGRQGEGWTDGSFMPVLILNQETSGWGPTGSMSADFKFFDERLTLYLMGQVAFLMTDIKLETGTFFTTTIPIGGPQVVIPAPAELTEVRSKSVWNTTGEIGIRVNLKNGLEFEVAYNSTGFLDAVLLPLELRVPSSAIEGPQGSSATYRTRDLIIQAWRAGIGFQF